MHQNVFFYQLPRFVGWIRSIEDEGSLSMFLSLDTRLNKSWYGGATRFRSSSKRSTRPTIASHENTTPASLPVVRIRCATGVPRGIEIERERERDDDAPCSNS